jgi:hypothetical protein
MRCHTFVGLGVLCYVLKVQIFCVVIHRNLGICRSTVGRHMPEHGCENIKCCLMHVRWYFWTSKRKTAWSVTDGKEENKPSAVSMRTCEVKVTLKRLQEDIKCFVVRSRSVQVFKLLICIKITWRQNTAIERTAEWDGRIILKGILKKWCVDWIGFMWLAVSTDRGYLWIQ